MTTTTPKLSIVPAPVATAFHVRCAGGRYLTFDLGTSKTYPAPRALRYTFSRANAERLVAQHPGATIEAAE